MTQENILVSGQAFKAMLSHVDASEQVKKCTQEYKEAKSISKRDILVKKIKYLDGLVRNDVKPDEAFVLHNLPVLPPILRPASVMGGNQIKFADVNNLYKDHMAVNNSLKELPDILDPSELITEREGAYNGIKAIVGLGEAISPANLGRTKGLLKQIGGEGGPKTGYFHSKLLSKKQDFSGRATIYAEPNLGFNQAAVPREQLWTMYKLHILRDLAKNGYNYVDSEKAWAEKRPAAINSFNKVIKQVPLLINRAPTLMKSNVTAVFPVPIEGNAMGINPIHLPLFSGDFDGDALSMYTPMTPEAVHEARTKILPQHQIHDYRRGLNSSLVAPGHEAIIGSMSMTEPDMDQEVVKFKTEADCLKALHEGKIKENTPVEIG